MAEPPIPCCGARDLALDFVEHLELESLDGVDSRVVTLADDAVAPDGYRFVSLRTFGQMATSHWFNRAGRASQLMAWHQTHRYCGRCGAATSRVTHEYARQCPACGLVGYPRLSPAIIVAVRQGDQLLLARSARFPKGVYSLLAGFVEPGESLEEAVAREVMEEAGIRLANIRYVSSQPWPFPHSLMIGFEADYAGGELRFDPGEIESGGWYRRDALPPLPPPASIAYRLIERFIVNEEVRSDQNDSVP